MLANYFYGLVSLSILGFEGLWQQSVAYAQCGGKIIAITKANK